MQSICRNRLLHSNDKENYPAMQSQWPVMTEPELLFSATQGL